MQKKIIFILLMLFASCNRLPESKGEFNEIVIISSDIDKKIYLDDVNQLLGGHINTPSEESKYILKWIDEDKFQYYLGYKNILFLNLTDPADSTIDNLVDKFRVTYDMDIFTLNDVYAENQNLFIFSSDNYLDFKNDIAQHGDWIIDNIDEQINKSLSKYIYRNGNNEEIELLLNNHFNINSSIQNDFLIVKDKLSTDDFIWIGRGYPYRWLCFDRIENINELDLWEFFKLSVSEHMPNVVIKDYYKSISYESDNFIRIQGLYEEKQSDTGGPFIVYAKFNSLDKTALLVSGFVNNPGKPKIRLLKELEIQILNSLDGNR
tara:strand:+ start:7970 stop:8929 length:960 start_codon:yes stop_codon:yes gene_type:complete